MTVIGPGATDGQHAAAHGRGDGLMSLRPCITCGMLLTKGSYCRRCYPRVSSGRQATFRRRTLALTGGRFAVCGSVDGVQAHHRSRSLRVAEAVGLSEQDAHADS